MNIMIGFSKKYFWTGTVAIKSLYESNKEIDSINLYVVTDGWSKENHDFVEDIARFYSRKIDFIDISLIGNYVELRKIQSWFGSYISYSKCFCDKLFPKVDKIICLDADIFVNKSLIDLWNYDLKNKTIGAVPDGTIGYSFNAGVMVIDLIKWREKEYFSKLTNKMGLVETKMVEQDLFNIVFGDDVELLPFKYNFVPRYHLIGYKKFRKTFPNSEITESDFYHLSEDSVIFHYNFVGLNRPFFEYDRVVSFKWSTMYEMIYKRKIKLPKRKAKLAKIANFFKPLIPSRLYRYFKSIILK